MTYEETVNYLYSLTNFENSRRFRDIEGFQNVETTLKLLGIDHKSKKIIHIAGTKGKGTVSYISGFLLSRFGKVGVFTSPHLSKINERISIFHNGIEKNISDEEFVYVASEVRSCIEMNNISLTTFDFLTVMAILYFDKKEVDYIVLEVGLGGRLDSTNFCIPKVSVITLIDYDHTNVLGRSLKKIASEKAGIIKPSIPVISSRQKSSARKVITDKATSVNSRIVFIDDIYEILDANVSIDGTRATVRYIPTDTIFQVRTNLIGKHFIENILLSYEAVNVFHTLDRSILENINLGIKGRFEILRKEPLIVFDVAHTPKSISNLLENYNTILGGKNFNIIVSLMRDKEHKKISETIAKYRDRIENIHILKIEANDGSNRLKKHLDKLGFGNVKIIDKVQMDLNNYLIFGSFRTYEIIKKSFANFNAS